MVGEMVKKQGRARLYISCNYSCTSYFLVKILLVKLKNLHTSACLKLNYCTTKQTKNLKVAKMVEFIKTCDKYPCQFWSFFQLHNPLALLLGLQCRKRALACPRSGLFNFRLLFAPANCSEIVQQIRDFRGDCLNI